MTLALYPHVGEASTSPYPFLRRPAVSRPRVASLVAFDERSRPSVPTFEVGEIAIVDEDAVGVILWRFVNGQIVDGIFDRLAAYALHTNDRRIVLALIGDTGIRLRTMGNSA